MARLFEPTADDLFWLFRFILLSCAMIVDLTKIDQNWIVSSPFSEKRCGGFQNGVGSHE
jgi:hypothetical protein